MLSQKQGTSVNGVGPRVWMEVIDVANTSAQIPVHVTQTTHGRALTLTRVLDMASYWMVMVGVYLTVGTLFFLGGTEKLFAAGGIHAPASIVEQFAGTWMASFPGGMDFFWGVLGVLELTVFLAIVASLLIGEFLPSHRKSFLEAGLALAILTFAFLGYGQNLTSNFAGVATQWSYLAGAGVLMILVGMLPPNRRRAWASEGGFEHEER